MEDYKKVNLESYNTNAAVFAEYFKSLLDVSGRKEFGKFIDLLDRNKEILDLGCGGGDHSLYFKEKGLNVVAIDLSEAMVKLARTKGIDARVMDIENLKFENDSFDGVWAVTSLLHVPKSKIGKVIDNLSDILRKKGFLYVCVKEGDGEEFIPDKQNPDTKRFFVLWNKEELLEHFKEKFELLDFWKHKPRDTTYLHFFFRNKK